MCKLDFYIPELNKCIEFQGTFWYQDNFKKHSRELEIKEIYPKLQFLYINEQDYKNNPEKVIQKCLAFII